MVQLCGGKFGCLWGGRGFACGRGGLFGGVSEKVRRVDGFGGYKACCWCRWMGRSPIG